MNIPAPLYEDDTPRETPRTMGLQFLTENTHNKPSLGASIKNMGLKEGIMSGMVKESTAWDVYNNEAGKVDTELVKDWRESLKSLLLFTAIFAAVLAAFLIESKKMLQQDPTDLLANLTLFSINNNGNITNLPFIPTPFEPTWPAISVNCLLFASLGVTLIAALSSVVALQWVIDYDAAITRGGSSPEDRAKRRQFRFSGVVSWKMGEIIASLPLLLYFSVFLFWVGAMQWMWSLNHVVGYVVASCTAIASLFYLFTTLLATIYVSAPFRTPLSRGIYWLLAPLTVAISQTVSRIAAQANVSRFTSCSPRVWSGLRARLDFTRVARSFFQRLNHWRMIDPRFPPHRTSRQREDEAAELDPMLRQKALGWLAQQLPISSNFHRKLLLLINEVLNISVEVSIIPLTLEEPWMAILDFLGWHYMRQILDGTLSEDDYEAVKLLLRCSMRPEIRDALSPGANYEKSPAVNAYWNQCCFSYTDIARSGIETSENMTFLLGRDIPIPTTSSKHELDATIRLIRWRNSAGTKKIRAWKETLVNMHLYSEEYLESCIRCFKLWLFAATEESRYGAMLQAAFAFDKAMKIEENPAFHAPLVWILCRDARRSGGHWRSSSYLENSGQQLARIRDPCFALIGGYSYGLPVSVEVTMTKAYMNEYSASLEILHSLLYERLLMTDLASLWQLRAAIAGSSPSTLIKLCRQALRDPLKMSYLERIFQHPVHCSGHSMGPQHLLYHLLVASDPKDSMIFRNGVTIFNTLDVGGLHERPVLAFLAFPVNKDTSFPTPGSGIRADCLGRIREMCEAAMKQPEMAFTLISDVATYYLRYHLQPSIVGLVLQATDRAMPFLEETRTTLPLDPLARTIQTHRRRMLQQEYGSKEYKEVLAAHAERICKRMQAVACTRAVSSASNGRLLCCARSNLSSQPATGWLSMHVAF